MTNLKLIKSEKGFNSLYININSKLLDNLTLYNSISIFFKKYLQNNNNQKYFILMRLKYLDTSSYVTLHKGLIVNNNQLESYYKYCLSILSIKSNDYTDKCIDCIIFDFFTIPPMNEKFYSDKWSELKSDEPIKLEKFSNSTITMFLPLNMDYESWGKIILKTINNLIVASEQHIYKINIKKNNASIDVYKNNIMFNFFRGFKNKSLINIATSELKIGWYLSKLPDFIEVLESKMYIKLLKLVGGISLFLIVSGAYHQFHKLINYYIFTFSFVYLMYRLMIVFFMIKQFLVNIYTGKLIVRNSPVNVFNTIFRCVGSAAKTTINFTVGTGVAYCLCYELDEILVQEGKEAYFVPGMKQVIRNMGAEELAKNFLNKAGIRDNLKNPRTVTQLLEDMSQEEKDLYESTTGEKWDDLYDAQKKLENEIKNKNSGNTSVLLKTVDEYIEKEDPFKTKK